MTHKQADSLVSHIILRQIKDTNTCYEKWMRPYLPGKVFYKLRQILTSGVFLTVESYISFVLNPYITDLTLDECAALIRSSNALSVCLLAFRIKHSKKSVVFHSSLRFCKLKILLYRLTTNSSISAKNLLHHYFPEDNSSLKFVFPVCPDYAHQMNHDGSYRYTFDGLGDKIGIVAQKAIDTCSLISTLSSSLVVPGQFQISFDMYVGDFEATDLNASRLGITTSEFLNRCSHSAHTIDQLSGINSSLFTDIIGGLDSWNLIIAFIQRKLNLYAYHNLKSQFPLINHDKLLLSRIPLYKRWYGGSTDLKQLFLSQILEYAAMGFIVDNYLDSDSILVASDHKAMRPYYNLCAKVAVIGRSAKY